MIMCDMYKTVFLQTPAGVYSSRISSTTNLKPLMYPMITSVEASAKSGQSSIWTLMSTFPSSLAELHIP